VVPRDRDTEDGGAPSPASCAWGTAFLQVVLKTVAKIRDSIDGSPHPVPVGVNIEQIAADDFEPAVKMAQEFLAWKDLRVYLT